MKHLPTPVTKENRLLQAKYSIPAWFYDILDYPRERQYRQWRPRLLKDISGSVLEKPVSAPGEIGNSIPQMSILPELTCRPTC